MNFNREQIRKIEYLLKKSVILYFGAKIMSFPRNSMFSGKLMILIALRFIAQRFSLI